MATEKIKHLTYTEQNDPDILEIANELSELENRKPHDSIRLLILDAGRERISSLKA
jgi:hypothetical protein